ncbi:hypothetical protein [Microbacterium aquimaris]|uniref:Uncharacterized protein n=1 Tax=Microbacterium aquimaris TaxID=459816 RepID=A0ABU5N3U6_9MICO|nr:hypothetical protein [Microbacterium aquimaris]MDZ8160762.1 hypothetical protein [Microbacterium aquimaris]
MTTPAAPESDDASSGATPTSADTPVAWSSPPPRPKRDVYGIVATIIAAIGLVPTLAVVLIGLIPAFNLVWWYLLVLFPFTALLAVLVLPLATVGIIVGMRRASRIRWSITAAVLGVVMVAPMALIFLSSLAV